ncbi:sigma-54 dependent transcriptional regulator [Reichenbachiella agarivorans]|uniref:Sigma-54 dependent transcriptional regulator n=1 Tax=Reichenbachiella agarivorans TaxID=2979464 RepID=A0ABY6CL02_9BACT|nr:sigma-54 dependent transcriptional regulator [Reichenbachiella agarivorans]UXP31196.1 sigma-54 dependent transcriptional regulator [Reichenbachiella agarivorans]
MEKEQSRILIVDDDPAVLTTARLFLKQRFSYVHTLSDLNTLTKVMTESSFDVVLLDMNYSRGENDGVEGLKLIEQIIRDHPQTEVIPITAYGEIDLAVEALKRGARDFITKPWQNEKLYATIANLLNLKKKQNGVSVLRNVNQPLIGGSLETHMIGACRSFNQMLQMIEKVAPTDANVLILGENGSGKELVARVLHQQSDRCDKPFIKIDLGSLVDSLFESELFGHAKGAFTDAQNEKEGKLQMANGGTLFLDEIGNISLSQQAKLLSVLQDRAVTKVGDNISVPLDIRIISATHADLQEMINQGDFRQDFLYRINTIEIQVPSLRQRVEDVPLLAQYYLNLFKNKYGKKSLKVTAEAIKVLQQYPWPGNIRELSHVIERTVILADHLVIRPADLALMPSHKENRELDLNIEDMEKTLILKALEKNNGNMTHASRDLGIDRQALYRRLEKYGL